MDRLDNICTISVDGYGDSSSSVPRPPAKHVSSFKKNKHKSKRRTEQQLQRYYYLKHQQYKEQLRAKKKLCLDSIDDEDEKAAKFLRELVASTPSQRNWRGILIALLVICGVLGLILCSIVLLMPPDDGQRIKGKKLEIDDIIALEDAVPLFNGTWVSEKEFIFRDPSGGLSVYNAAGLTSRVLMSNATFRQHNANKYLISADLKFVLLIHDIEKVYRHSYNAKYTVYEVATEHTFPLTPEPEDLEEGMDQPVLQKATWSPTGNGVVLCHNNDLYYKPSVKSKEVIRLTSTGKPGVVFNGVPDWLYEEEILSSANAVWFSPDGQMLLFATFDDSEVGEVFYAHYGPVGEGVLPYPEIRSIRYPKAGTMNPSVTLWAVDLSDPKNLKPRDLKPPLGIRDQDHYFTAAKWLNNHKVAVVWMNRRQNVSIITVCSGVLWNCPEFYKHQVSKGWVEIYTPPMFSKDGTSCIVRLPVQEGSLGSFQQINLIQRVSSKDKYLKSNKEKVVVTPLTQGAFDVTRILAWEEPKYIVYFEAAPPGTPGQRHLYKVQYNALFPHGISNRRMECLTCPRHTTTSTKIAPLAISIDTPCLYNWVLFSPACDFFVRDCRGPSIPYVTLFARNNTKLALLNDHGKVRAEATVLALPQVRIFSLEIPKGYLAQVRMFFPPGFRDYDNMKFPLVLQVYGGPGTQLVSSQWSIDWGTYLCSKRNFIVAQIDGRGSGFQGDKMSQALHLKLGTLEVQDQIAITKYLRKTYSYIDGDNMAVWGWSYGGFVSSMIVAEDNDIFKCGIAVAPVTKWQLYSSTYSERYLGWPNGSTYKAYDVADVTLKAGNFEERPFFLVHGMADDNVHDQNALLLAKALIEKGIVFRYQAYPDENHSLSGVKKHLYKAMESFLDDCFDPIDFEDWELAAMFGLRH